MSGWSISDLQECDLEEFVRCQFLAFEGNDLHDAHYPDQKMAVESHRKALAARSQVQPGNETTYVKIIDDASGQIIGGFKASYYGNEDVRTSSPYASALLDEKEAHSDAERYRTFVFNYFMQRRIEGTQYPHASESNPSQAWPTSH